MFFIHTLKPRFASPCFASASTMRLFKISGISCCFVFVSVCVACFEVASLVLRFASLIQKYLYKAKTKKGISRLNIVENRSCVFLKFLWRRSCVVFVSVCVVNMCTNLKQKKGISRVCNNKNFVIKTKEIKYFLLKNLFFQLKLWRIRNENQCKCASFCVVSVCVAFLRVLLAT